MIFRNAIRLPLPIDHAGYGVTDLSALVAVFNRLGFAPTEEKELMARRPDTGELRPLGQRSAHVIFEKGYLELSAPVAGHNHLVPRVARYPGLHILAMAADNAEKQREDCRQCYPGLAAVAQASRDIRYGKNHGQARFRWFPLPAEVFSEGIVCCVEHLTRDLVFQPEAWSHPNGVCALAGISLVAGDPEQMKSRYEPFSGAGRGLPNVHETGYLRIIPYADMADSGLVRAIPDGNAMLGLEMETGSLTTLKRVLSGNGVDFREYPEAGALVSLPALNSFVLFREKE